MVDIKTTLKAILAVEIVFAFLLIVHLVSTEIIFRRHDMTDYDISKSTYKFYTVTEDNVKLLGRSEIVNDVRYFSMSGSGVEFLLKGKYADITVVGDNISSANKNHYSRIAIYLNGELKYDELVDYEEKTYRIDVDNYADGGVIRLIKLSEPMFSSFGISKIEAFCKKDIEPTAPSELKIEFYGDSITCGYGIDEENPNGSFSTETENFSKTYAYITANSLAADYSAVSFSGYGVYTGFSYNKRKEEYTIKKQYDKSVILSDNQERLWDFGSFVPNLVVVNLGTNDAAYCSKSQNLRQEFRKSYVEFLNLLRDRYPDAYILCILGDMNDSMYSEIELAVDEFRSTRIDNRVSCSQIGFKMNEYSAVVDGHPNDESNLAASTDLYMIIQELINYGEIY